MSHDNLRRRIAREAARLIHDQDEFELDRARARATRRICGGPVSAAELPSLSEIRAHAQTLGRIYPAADGRDFLDAHDLADARNSVEAPVDRFLVYRLLLWPLEEVRQNPELHPEGDALYHSLQVFDLAREALPYDEEFQLAGLLHDVGKGIDPTDHVAAGLAALDGHITSRIAWLIEHQPAAVALREGTLGARSRRRLEASESFEELLLLSDCDRRGRRSGVVVPDVDEALEHVRELSRLCGEEE